MRSICRSFRQIDGRSATWRYAIPSAQVRVRVRVSLVTTYRGYLQVSHLTVGGELLLDDGIDKGIGTISSPSSPGPGPGAGPPGYAARSLAKLLCTPLLLRRLDIAEEDEPIMPKAPAAGRL